MRFYFLFSVFYLLATGVSAGPAASEFSVAVEDQELNIYRYPSNGSRMAIWIMPGMGEPDRMFRTAQQLAESGVEVWLVDLAESLFLPAGPATMRQLDGRYVAGLIEAAHRQTSKNIVLIGRSYSAIPVLRGARSWQQRQQSLRKSDAYLTGAILFSPELYATIPALGLEPVFEPIAEASNIPIVLFQADKRGNRGQLETLVSKLQSGGSSTFVKILPGVTGLYYHEDTAPETLATLETIPAQMIASMKLLDQAPLPMNVVALPKAAEVKGLGLDTQLNPFKGNPVPQPINLQTARGQQVVRKDYSGRVTLVNFWASWCGPCVEEIPSLNNLRELMDGQAFELISVNYAEDPKRIAGFLKKVQVDFPVLMDVDGLVSNSWKVLVFPATFVIGPEGKIVYGVNGAIHWDNPGVVSELKALLKTR